MSHGCNFLSRKLLLCGNLPVDASSRSTLLEKARQSDPARGHHFLLDGPLHQSTARYPAVEAAEMRGGSIACLFLRPGKVTFSSHLQAIGREIPLGGLELMEHVGLSADPGAAAAEGEEDLRTLTLLVSPTLLRHWRLATLL
jgi:hypothetical protein